ncbi:MAG: hypothetical protein PF961_23735 [Planctomycetota bacterium]|jgi:tetratricopeptide (TPR) repeat protein|nr:hypothetical protein [Planctomycetota bacterium]
MLAARKTHPSWLGALLLVTLALPLAAADAPTTGEWAPIQAAIVAEHPQARARLAALMEGRSWPDGWVKLADLDRQAADYRAAFAHAGRAFKALPRDKPGTPHQQTVRANAAWIAINAGHHLGKYAACVKVFDTFKGMPDPGGEVHFRMAEAALEQDLPRSKQLLTAAKQLVSAGGASVPIDYRVLEARQYEQSAQAATDTATRTEALIAAALTYERAVDGQSQLGARYNLGRLQRQIASLDPERNEEFLAKAAASFKAVLEADPQDADARFELGLIRLEQGKDLAAFNALNQALEQYLADPNRSGTWMVATAYRGRGAATLQLAEAGGGEWTHEDALTDLKRAEQLGENSPDLYNNLLVACLALQRRRDGTDTELAAKINTILNDHRDAIEPTNLALTLLHQARAALIDGGEAEMRSAFATAGNAAGLLAASLGTDLQSWASWTDPNREHNNSWRYLGHALFTQAALAERLDAENGHSNDATQLRQHAYAAWRVAGSHGDGQAQQHYLAYASNDDPATAYAAGWVVLGWSDYLSGDAWRSVIGNYGASQRWRSPIHLGIWGLLLILFLVLGLKSRFHAAPEVLEAGSPERQRPANTPNPPSPPPAKKPAAARPQASAPAKPSGGGKKLDETLLPDSMYAGGVPKRRVQALERRASDPGSDDGAATEEMTSEETQSYAPGQAPGRPRTPDPGGQQAQNRNAVNDVARRLAREQGQAQNDPAAPRPRRRR